MILFSADELRALLGRPLTDAQYELAHDTAEDILRGEVGDRLGDPPQPGVKSIAMAVGARVLTNPAGVRSEQAGGMIVSYADAQTGVALSVDELRRLKRAVGLAAGAGMLDIGPTDSTTRFSVWRPV
ncbi:hypothetical protein OG436_29365 [Streptomyces caniferus]|uniref:hypothetical protein n=1 Tax=Streptomyces caniferus TaxID=285557 RepID=UPI002E29E2AD|nr:hypothetical protein [Streptomyces caniferus]